MCLGEGITAEAILIPDLKLQNTTTSIPQVWSHYDANDWAMQDDGLQGPVGILLLGADCTALYPDDVFENNQVVRTDHCRLKRSRISGKLMMFGEGKSHEQQKVTGKNVNIRVTTAMPSDSISLQSNTDFSIFWPHVDDIEEEYEADTVDQY